MKDCDNCVHKDCCYILAKGIFCEEEVKERQIDCPYMPIIVKCKNCRHREEDHHCWALGLLTRDDDFCSFAERKDKE